MKSLKVETDLSDFQRLLKHAKNTQVNLVVWQVNSNKREINDAILGELNWDGGYLSFKLKEKGRMLSDLPIYCYCERDQYIFKSTPIEVVNQNITSTIPAEIMQLEGADQFNIPGVTDKIKTHWEGKTYGGFTQDLGNDVMKVKSMSQRSSRDQDFLKQEFMPIDEEDKKFADVRESPRARPKEDKQVKVFLKEINAAIEFRLFDLSRGGMGFLVDNEFLFTKGMEVQVVGFAAFDLDDPLIGHVMGVRPLDEDRKEFKIGVKFLEGQD